MNTSERSSLLTNTLDRVNLAERQLEIQAKERFFQTRCFRLQILFGLVAQAIQFFAPLYHR
jgi:hypothetical protein